MLRSCWRIINLEHIARVVRSGGSDVSSDDLAAGLQGESHADAGAISPSRCRGCTKRARRMGVPILTSRGLRGRRRDRDAGDQGGRRAASTSAIVTGDKDFFQLVGGRIRVFNPRDEGAWCDAEGVVRRSSASRPEQVVRRARADGRLDRQREGRARHRREGARASSSRARIARVAADACRRDAAEDVSRGAARQRRQARQASRELLTIRTDVDVPFDADAVHDAPGANRERCYELFSRLGFRIAAARTTRPRRRRSQSTTACQRPADELSRAGRQTMRRPRSACTC